MRMSTGVMGVLVCGCLLGAAGAAPSRAAACSAGIQQPLVGPRSDTTWTQTVPTEGLWLFETNWITALEVEAVAVTDAEGRPVAGTFQRLLEKEQPTLGPNKRIIQVFAWRSEEPLEPSASYRGAIHWTTSPYIGEGGSLTTGTVITEAELVTESGPSTRELSPPAFALEATRALFPRVGGLRCRERPDPYDGGCLCDYVPHDGEPAVVFRATGEKPVDERLVLYRLTATAAGTVTHAATAYPDTPLSTSVSLALAFFEPAERYCVVPELVDLVTDRVIRGDEYCVSDEDLPELPETPDGSGSPASPGGERAGGEPGGCAVGAVPSGRVRWPLAVIAALFVLPRRIRRSPRLHG